MKSLLILFLTVLTGGNQSVNWEKSNAYFGNEEDSYVQRVKEYFFYERSSNYSLITSGNLLSIYDEEYLLSEDEIIEETFIQRLIINKWYFILLFSTTFIILLIKRGQKMRSTLTNAIVNIQSYQKESPASIVNDFRDAENEKRYITLERETAILKQVESFEKGKGFLDKNISLNVLSARFGVNHRYLSYVVNKHKECDFATYVNELRVKYIVDCLEQKPEYLKYKISYLAEQCGFASHSRFTVTFKKVTGYPPSIFINNVRIRKEK